MNAPDILVDVEKTAASGDVLSSTELDQPPLDGVILLFAASSVNTATLEVPQFGHNPGITNLLPLAANGIPLADRVVPYKIPVQKGKRPIIALAGTTGTCHFTAAFYARR